jgi:hypothetical protein
MGIILKWSFEKWDGGMDWIDLAQDGQVAGCCECGDEPSCSIKCVGFLELLRICKLLRKASTPCS